MDELTIANAEEHTRQLRECWRLESENESLRTELTATKQKLARAETCVFGLKQLLISVCAITEFSTSGLEGEYGEEPTNNLLTAINVGREALKAYRGGGE